MAQIAEAGTCCWFSIPAPGNQHSSMSGFLVGLMSYRTAHIHGKLVGFILVAVLAPCCEAIANIQLKGGWNKDHFILFSGASIVRGLVLSIVRE